MQNDEPELKPDPRNHKTTPEESDAEFADDKARSQASKAEKEYHRGQLREWDRVNGVTAQSWDELPDVELKPVEWIIDHFLPAGFTILSSKPKSGKSFLALQIMNACASGVLLWPDTKYLAKRCYVVMMDYEEDEFLKRRRYEYIQAIPSDNGCFYYDWPHGAIALDKLRKWFEREDCPEPGLVIVDTLGHFFGQDLDWNNYAATISTIAPLKDLCDEYGWSLLGVTHDRKSGGLDFMDAVAGSVGVTATSKSILNLNKPSGSQLGTLRGKGRELIDIDISLELEIDRGWKYRGSGLEYRASELSHRILACIREAGEPLNARDVCEMLGDTDRIGSVKTAILRMATKGLINKTSRGHYGAPGELYS
jgi:hypothetical protein